MLISYAACLALLAFIDDRLFHATRLVDKKAGQRPHKARVKSELTPSGRIGLLNVANPFRLHHCNAIRHFDLGNLHANTEPGPDEFGEFTVQTVKLCPERR